MELMTFQCLFFDVYISWGFAWSCAKALHPQRDLLRGLSAWYICRLHTWTSMLDAGRPMTPKPKSKLCRIKKRTTARDTYWEMRLHIHDICPNFCNTHFLKKTRIYKRENNYMYWSCENSVIHTPFKILVDVWCPSTARLQNCITSCMPTSMDSSVMPLALLKFVAM